MTASEAVAELTRLQAIDREAAEARRKALIPAPTCADDDLIDALRAHGPQVARGLIAELGRSAFSRAALAEVEHFSP